MTSGTRLHRIGCVFLLAGCTTDSAAPPETTASPAPATGGVASASAAASIFIAGSPDAFGALSGSAPSVASAPPAATSAGSAADARNRALANELNALELKALASLGTSSSAHAVLRGGTSDGELSRAGRGRSDPAPPAGRAQGGLADIGLPATASIGGRPPETARPDDVEKAIRDAGCTSARTERSPATIFEARCDGDALTVTFVPSGAKLEPARRAAIEQDAAVFTEGGVLLAVRPGRGADLEKARALLRRLHEAPRKTTAKGDVIIGGASVSGGSVPNAAAVVAGMAAGFRRCYNRGLAEAPDAAGALTLVLEIGSDGSVAKSESRAGAGLPEVVVACVRARGSSSMFDAPSGGRATIEVPIRFSPSKT